MFLPTDCAKDTVRAACRLYGAGRMTSFGDDEADSTLAEGIISTGGAADAIYYT
jgi:hypothetical protein